MNINWTLSGYKGKIGGFGLIATAIGTVCVDIYHGKAPDWNAFMTLALQGLGILGIRLALK